MAPNTVALTISNAPATKSIIDIERMTQSVLLQAARSVGAQPSTVVVFVLKVAVLSATSSVANPLMFLKTYFSTILTIVEEIDSSVWVHLSILL